MTAAAPTRLSFCVDRRALLRQYTQAVGEWHRRVSDLHLLTYPAVSYDTFRQQFTLCEQARETAENAKVEFDSHCSLHGCA